MKSVGECPARKGEHSTTSASQNRNDLLLAPVGGHDACMWIDRLTAVFGVIAALLSTPFVVEWIRKLRHKPPPPTPRRLDRWAWLAVVGAGASYCVAAAIVVHGLTTTSALDRSWALFLRFLVGGLGLIAFLAGSYAWYEALNGGHRGPAVRGGSGFLAGLGALVAMIVIYHTS